MRLFKSLSFAKRFLFFMVITIAISLFILPSMAPYWGRQQLAVFHPNIRAHPFFVWSNRTYMQRSVLNENKIPYGFENIKVTYLDAAFPFPLPIIPHLSHKDGLNLDIRLPFQKPFSPLGYFIYAKPFRQAQALCSRHYKKGIAFDREKTKAIVNSLAENARVKKIFIEPWMKKELNLSSGKIRFAGCHAARHDDHIHIDFAP